MKLQTLALLLGGAVCSLMVQAQNKYRLIWQDDFNEQTFDTQAWSKIPRGQPDWKRHMTDYDSCYAVKEGNLVLRGLVNDYCPNDTSRYLTGGLYTKRKKAISYGKVEVKAKLQGAQGAWPAIWMKPDRNVQWPHGGEIDIMERLNHDSIAYQTIHTNYTHHLHFDQEPPHGSTGPINPDEYNVYSVEILPDSLVFAINGHHTFSYPRLPGKQELGQYPFGKPFYLLIDMQIEGSWVGKADSKQLPVEMWVDWVKMYEWIP